MFVPAMTFAWWLVAMPSRPVQVTPAWPTRDEMAVEAARESQRANRRGERGAGDGSLVNLGTEWTGGKTKLHGPVTPALARAAHAFLDLPMGTERMLEVEGHPYVFVLEWHYHPPGFVGGPNGWHKGVTVYEAN